MFYVEHFTESKKQYAREFREILENLVISEFNILDDDPAWIVQSIVHWLGKRFESQQQKKIMPT